MSKYYSLDDRNALHPQNFGDPIRKLFPILDQEDLDKAPSRIRRLEGREELKKNIVAIANRKGLILPTEFQTEVSIDKKVTSE